MLQVIVLGSGLIPRGYGIAPRKTPFEVDLNTVKLFAYTAGLNTYAINPTSGAKVLLTPSNYEKTYKLFTEIPTPVVEKPKPVTKPVSPQPIVLEPKTNPQPVNPAPLKEAPTNQIQNAVMVVEEPKEDQDGALPVISNPNNQNNNKHNKK